LGGGFITENSPIALLPSADVPSKWNTRASTVADAAEDVAQRHRGPHRDTIVLGFPGNLLEPLQGNGQRISDARKQAFDNPPMRHLRGSRVREEALKDSLLAL
jgi:hypothetical protein